MHDYLKILLLSSFVLLLSCEESMVIIPPFEAPETDKTVLIEDLTGVQCPNCPKGAAAIETILELFKGNVFAIAIHGDVQAEPIPGESKFDFRNEFAKNLEEFHIPFLGKPSAAINRAQFSGELFIPVDNVDVWASYVEQELNRDVEINMFLNEAYDSASRTISFDMTAVPVVDLSGDYRVSVFVTESEIEDAQENQGTIIEEYEHNHVLRDMMTKFDGDNLGTNLVKDQSIKKSFTYTIPNEFNDAHIEIVVSIHESGSTTKRVLQSAGFKINQ